MRASAGLEYKGLSALRGPLAFLSGARGTSYREQVEIVGADGVTRAGRVLSVSGDSAVIELFSGGEGLELASCRVLMLGQPLRFGVGDELLGRVFDGLGRPRDGLPPPPSVEERPIDGAPINPCRREDPRDVLETGVSAIDGLNTLVLGQKLPIFSESGLAHDALVLQIIRQARAPRGESFAVVFVGLGLPREVAMRYEEDFRRSGALGRVTAFLNYADDPAAERLIAPRCALTAAEFLAFDRGRHVLVVLNDMTNYGEALREVSSAAGEVPSRKGYPGYLYSDLASIFERAGRIRGLPGSLTQLPVVTMPSGDLTHPIPDLTGYITEGQVVLDRDLARRGVDPAVAVLPSLSRLMGDSIGAGSTRADHGAVAQQVYVAYARAVRARSLESIIGSEELSAVERAYLAFGEQFEKLFLSQRQDERRTLAQTLDIAWETLAVLPESELTRIPEALLAERAARPDAPQRSRPEAGSTR
jgi:V/A-type H+-transporting ATPase subunit B